MKAINTLKVLAASQQSWEGGDCVGMDQNPRFGQRGGGAVVLPSPRSLPSSSRGRAVVLARPRGVREPGQEVRLSHPSETMPGELKLKPSTQVNCLTVSREPLSLWLPPGLSHSLAVRAVDEMLEVSEKFPQQMKCLIEV